jgi:Protein of unknown function (DUF1189)
MKHLFDNIQKSIYAPEYYQSLLTQPLRQSLKYLAALVLLLAVFLTIATSIPLVAGANAFVRAFPEKFFAYFPDELEIRATNGVVSSNVTEPYSLPIPVEIEDIIPTQGGEIENIAVIDTTTPFSMEQFEKYKAVFWLGRDQLAYRDNAGSVRIDQISKRANYVMNESLLREYEAKLSPYYRFVGPLIVLVIFVALIIGFGFNFVYLFFGALLIMLLGKTLNRDFSYWQAYQIGLHAITLPLFIDALLGMSSLAFLHIPFAPTAIMLLVVYVNMRALEPTARTPVVADVAPTPEPTKE